MAKDGGKAYEESLLTDWSKPPPNFVLRSVLSVASGLRNLLNKILPPTATTLTLASSFIPSAWLAQVAKLGIPDLLKDGPLTAAELAAKAGGVREDDLYRALRMLAVQGIFEALPGAGGQPTRFRNNAASATLRTDHPSSVRHLVIHWYTDVFSAFGPEHVAWHLRQRGPIDDVPAAFEHAHGKDYWQYLKDAPELSEVFSKAMTNADSLGLEATLSDFHWRGFKRVVDIAGANGSVLAALLQRYPGLQGVLFDQPHVIEDAKKEWQARPAWKAVGDRVTMVGGDLFKPETLPQLRDGDLAFMRHIIHDWSDEASVRILKALRQTIGGAKVTLVLCELALDPEFSFSPMHSIRYVIDLHMQNTLRSKERTVEQYRALFEASGFRLVKVHQIRAPESLVEVVPV